MNGNERGKNCLNSMERRQVFSETEPVCLFEPSAPCASRPSCLMKDVVLLDNRNFVRSSAVISAIFQKENDAPTVYEVDVTAFSEGSAELGVICPLMFVIAVSEVRC